MHRGVILPLAILFGASDCAARSSVEEDPPERVQQEHFSMMVEPIFTQAVSGVSARRRLVIREVETWAELWDEVVAQRRPPPEVPRVDFDREMVIVAAMGTRATGGYAITIEDVSRREGRLVVTVREWSPGPGCLTTQAFTAPVTAVRVPRSGDPVVFVEQKEKSSCGRGR